MRIFRSSSLAALSLASLLALSACGGDVPEFEQSTSASETSSASAAPASSSASASASPSASASASASATASASGGSISETMKAELAPVNAFVDSMYSEGASAKTTNDLLVDQIVNALPADVQAPEGAKDSELIAQLDEATAQGILDQAKSKLPYSSVANVDGMSVQNQLSLLLAFSSLSASLNEGQYVYKEFQEMKGFTIINFEGSDRITFHQLTSNVYDKSGKLTGKSNPEENFDFVVVKTGDEWKLDGAKMLEILENRAQQNG